MKKRLTLNFYLFLTVSFLVALHKPKSKFEKDWLKSINGYVKFFFTIFGIFALLIGIGFTLAGVSQLTKPDNNYESLFIAIGVPLCFVGPRILEHLNELKNSIQPEK